MGDIEHAYYAGFKINNLVFKIVKIIKIENCKVMLSFSLNYML